jgi:transketolase
MAQILSGIRPAKYPASNKTPVHLGHGLANAVGLALAGKQDNRSYRVFVLLGDGELTEGSVWEAAMSAANFGLDNLVGIIDRNRLQITGPTETVMRLEPLDEKFRAFGFAVRNVEEMMSRLCSNFSSSFRLNRENRIW